METINPHEVDPIEAIRNITDGRGADVCVDAVGTEAERSFFEKAKAVLNSGKGTVKVMEQCFEAVRRGGIVTVVGVYGSPYDNFPVHRIFDKGITIQLGQAPVQNYIDQLLQLVTDQKVVLNDIVSHQLPLTEASYAYDIFKKERR